MKKIVIVALILVLAFALVIVVAVSQKDSDENQPVKLGASNQQVSTPDEIINKSFSNLDDFTSETLSGGTFTSENFKDYDLTVVNIWGTFCPPCRAEMPELASFANALPSRIQFITICTDATGGNIGSAKTILSDAGFGGVTIISGDEQLYNLLNKVEYVPTTLFFDSNGNCVGEEIIGSPQNFSETYKSSINEILSSMGKELI